MTIHDVSLPYENLLARRTAVAAAARSAVLETFAGQSGLRDAVLRLLESDLSQESAFRLLPFPIVEALAGEPDKALLVCVVSRLWWAGAESFDDLNDGEFDSRTTGLTPAAAGLASTVLITLLPQDLLTRQRLSAQLRSELLGELTGTSLQAASGQFDDVSAVPENCSWSAVMRGYAGKSGAPYARDAAMAARLAGADPPTLRTWRAFGSLFGILRQLANDHESLWSGNDADLANSTPTLVLANALESATPADRRTLLELGTQAVADINARHRLRNRLIDQAATDDYRSRVGAIHHKLSELWQELVPASTDRDLVQWMIDFSAEGTRRSRMEPTR